MPVNDWYVTSHTKLVASNDSTALVMCLQSGLGSACPIPGGMPGETPLWFYKATGSWTHGSFPWGEGRDCRVENYLDLR